MAQHTETAKGSLPMIDTQVDLGRKIRLGEVVIQSMLFVFAIVSILTTIGTVYVLASESINFFTSTQWIDINKRLLEDFGPTATRIQVTTGGKSIDPGNIIGIRNEKLLVKEVIEESDEMFLVVDRGFDGTKAEIHDSGESLNAAQRVSIIEYFASTDWSPQLGKFGIWPLLTATLMTASIAMLVALPLGLGVAIYLSEYASQRARSIIKPILEVLSGIPTVVYGYFALTFMTPLLRSVFGREVEIYNTASAGLVIGILILPLVSSMSEDALSAVPRALREAAYGLGATKFETATRIVVPAALSGITAAFIVSISRAIGETMVVAIAAGAGPNFTFNPFKPAETMTGHIVRISGGDLSYDSIDYNSLFSIGLLLFVMTLALNIFSQRIVRRFREVYE